MPRRWRDPCTSAMRRPSTRSRRWSRIQSIDCVWLCGPNFARVENMERIVAAIKKGAKLTGDRLREAARPKRRRGGAHGAAGRGGRRPARLPREPAVCAEPRARQADHLGARRVRGGPAIPGAGRRGAQRPAHAVVLAGRSAGRRRVERHDVPQPRGRPLPADQTRRAARQHPPGQSVGADRLAQVVAAGLRVAAARHR